jgi:putative tryptophan/tyrosine transport system substrate-binding protein
MRHPSRRQLIQRGVALGGLTLLAPGMLSACGLDRSLGFGQPKMRRIGILGESPDPEGLAYWKSFRDGLRDLGYVEGQNITIDQRWSEGVDERFAANTAELISLGVECLVTAGATPSVKAKQANSTVPLVVTLVNFDAIQLGLVENIARPEGNVTGSAGASGLQVQTKLVEILKDAIPDLQHVAVLANPKQPGIDVVLAGVQQAAQRLGIQADITPVTTTDDIALAFPRFNAAGAQALIIINQSIFSSSLLASLILAHRLPAITTDMAFPDAGGFLAYGVDRPAIYRHMATYVDKILKGAKPGDLPMERPQKYDLFLNLKTAQALGLSITPGLHQQVTRFIE